MPGAEEASSDHLSLYRRFRPQRFDEVLGQDHVVVALRNAVRQGKVAHAYLFSGPRGTGKTSTARILAKALNCAAPEDGEPCGRCQSCVEISRGASLDVHELDAASNNGVDAMRELVARAALGTPGRWKVYIVDEVHMLSTPASNALLKTLEEPPGHVVFVLATTDPQKVLATVRSRTQHFEFRLLGRETLDGLVHQVSAAAHLELGDEALAAAVRRGKGSARDALSALDQLAAAGMVDDEVPVLAEMGAALADRDATLALVALSHAVAAGRDAHALTAALAEHLRQGFLLLVAPQLASVPPEDRPEVEEMARRLGLPALVRAMEALGRAQVDMRDAPDPRVHLEATLIRLAHPEADDSPAALLERIERLERALAGVPAAPGGAPAAPGGAPAGASSPSSPPPPPPTAEGPPALGARRAPAPAPPPEVEPSPSPGTLDPSASGAAPPASPSPGGAAPSAGPDLARQSLGALRRQSQSRRPAGPPAAGPPAAGPPADPVAGTAAPASSTPSNSSDVPPPAAQVVDEGTSPSRDALVEAWGDGLLTRLPPRARARFRVGRFIDAQGDTAVFALPNDTHRSYCEDVRLEVEQVLSAHFGTPVHLRLVVDEEGDPAAGRGTPGAQSRPPGPSRGQGPEATEEATEEFTGRASPGDGDPAASSPSARAGSVARAQAQGRGESRARPTRDSGEAGVEEHGALLDPVVLEAETEPAGAGLSAEQRVRQLFPGAEEV